MELKSLKTNVYSQTGFWSMFCFTSVGYYIGDLDFDSLAAWRKSFYTRIGTQCY